MAKRCLNQVDVKSKSEARNLPTWGCKSMMEGPTIMLGEFITLLYIYTMPNKHYSSKPTSLMHCGMYWRCYGGVQLLLLEWGWWAVVE